MKKDFRNYCWGSDGRMDMFTWYVIRGWWWMVQRWGGRGLLIFMSG